MKKKIVSLLLVAAMVLAMVGCGSKDAESGDSKDSKAAEETEVANAKALADQDFDTSYEPKKDEYKIYCKLYMSF